MAAAHTAAAAAAEPEMTLKVPEVVLDVLYDEKTDPKPNLFVKIQIYQVQNPA